MRNLLFKLARLLGDVNAVKKGRVGKRAGRRAAGKATGKGLKKLFKSYLNDNGGGEYMNKQITQAEYEFIKMLKKPYYIEILEQCLAAEKSYNEGCMEEIENEEILKSFKRENRALNDLLSAVREIMQEDTA